MKKPVLLLSLFYHDVLFNGEFNGVGGVGGANVSSLPAVY